MNNIVGIVIGIFGALASFIFYLLKANQGLKQDNAYLKTDNVMKESVTKAEAQEEKANESQKTYEQIRDEYFRTHPNDKRDGS